MLDSNNAIDAFDGIVTSIITGFLTTCNMPGWLKQVVVLAVAVALAALRCYLTGQFKDTTLAAAIVVVAGSAWVAYQTVLKDLVKQLQASGPIKDPAPLVIPPTGQQQTGS